MKTTTLHLTQTKVAIACLTFLTLSALSLHASADNIDDFVKAEMTKTHIPGMSVAVIQNNQVIKEQAYGVANLELNVPATLDTVYALASMTKIFTTTGIMLLVQEGKITLDESITKVLPQLPAKWSHVTIRNCLSHTSGLPDEITDDVNVTPITGDRDELFKILAKKPLAKLGEKSVYNQTGFTILSMIIEKVSGMSYEEFMRARVFEPAKMSNASYGDGWSVIPGRSDLYTALAITKDHQKLLMGAHGPEVMQDKIYHYGSKYMPTLMAPAGLLNGSIRDLLNWEKTMADGTLLTAASQKEMATPYRLNSGKDGDFGLGYLTVSFGGPYKAVSYGGGAATWRVSYPERNLTVIVLTNLQGDQPQAIAAKIAALVDPEVADK